MQTIISLYVAVVMNQITHLDYFTYGIFMGKLEGKMMKNVANKFGIAKSIVGQLWKRFYKIGIDIRQYSSDWSIKINANEDSYVQIICKRNN